jgi:hypothetical protein
MHLDEIIIIPIILMLAFSFAVPMDDKKENLAIVSPTPTTTGGTAPLITPTPINCPATSTRSYTICQAYPGPGGFHPTPPAAQNYDINPITIRGYTLFSATKGFINLNPQPDDDPNAPQLYYILNKNPVFNNLYKIGRAPWDPPTLPYEVHIVELAANPNDPIRVPEAGSSVLPCGKDVIVLFADQNNITLKYTQDDTVTGGYTLHISDICVDPELLKLYQQNSQTRNFLPALQRNDILGIAKTNEIKVAIRDSGTFMDPRSKKDWWQRPSPL